MTNPLAVSLKSTRTSTNIARPGDTLRFTFSQPPESATNVEIDIHQAQLSSGPDLIPGRVLATFRGSIAKRRYIPKSVQKTADPLNRDMVIILSDGVNSVRVFIVDPGPMNFRNELQVSVRGRIKGKNGFFRGKAALFVEYPMVMIVPEPVAKSDLSLNVVSSWANQWRAKDPNVRSIVRIKPVPPPPGDLKPSDYDPLVAAFQSAAQQAPGGIVALATGHGDGGQGSIANVAWCNWPPEDKAPKTLPDGTQVFDHTLMINQDELADGVDGTVAKANPGPRTRVKLNALDRVADAVAAAALPTIKGAKFAMRRLLLHTCNVGNNTRFTQLIADRVRMPVVSHSDFIAYTGAAGSGTILAHYDSDAPVSPRDLTEWPISRISAESRPSTAPARRFPLQP
jgi:hypothetical protein